MLEQQVRAIACHSTQSLAQRQDQQQLNQVIDEQSEETV